MEHPIKILIVEDNVIIADDMQSMLEEIGYEIVDNVIVYEQAVDVLKIFVRLIIFHLYSSPLTLTGQQLKTLKL